MVSLSISSDVCQLLEITGGLDPLQGARLRLVDRGFLQAAWDFIPVVAIASRYPGPARSHLSVHRPTDYRTP